MSDQELVQLKFEGPIAWVTLNTPQKRNAINTGLASALQGALREVGSREDVRVMVLTGAGPSFCAGHDVHELMDRMADRDGYINLPGAASPVPNAIRALPQITIAMVNGHALGEGQDIALTCDLVVAAESAQFGDLHFPRGVLPSSGCWLLPRLVGPKRAMEYLLLGTILNGVEAKAAGLVNRVAPAEHLEEATRELAAEILATPPKTAKFLKRCVQKGMDESLAQTLEFVTYARSVAAKTDDAVVGGRTFLGDSAQVKNT